MMCLSQHQAAGGRQK